MYTIQSTKKKMYKQIINLFYQIKRIILTH